MLAEVAAKEGSFVDVLRKVRRRLGNPWQHNLRTGRSSGDAAFVHEFTCRSKSYVLVNEAACTRGLRLVESYQLNVVTEISR